MLKIFQIDVCILSNLEVVFYRLRLQICQIIYRDKIVEQKINSKVDVLRKFRWGFFGLESFSRL